MEDCSLDLIFYKGRLEHLVFWWGRICFFSPTDETRFLDKVKAFISVIIESPFIIAIRPCTQPPAQRVKFTNCSQFLSHNFFGLDFHFYVIFLLFGIGQLDNDV